MVSVRLLFLKLAIGFNQMGAVVLFILASVLTVYFVAFTKKGFS
jgi:hypothetical protein